MDFGGRYRFGAKRSDVWAALNDVHVLKAVIPGCEHIEWTSPQTLDLRIRVNFGVIHPVSIGPGLMTLARSPRLPNSYAAASTTRSSAAFVAP